MKLIYCPKSIPYHQYNPLPGTNSNRKRQLSHFHNYTQLWDQEVNASYSNFGSWIHIYPNTKNANQVALEFQKILTNKVWNEILMEINTFKRLSHLTLLKYIGFNIHGFNGSSRLVVLMEKPVFNQTLHTLLEESDFYSSKSNTKKQCLIYGLAKAMEYLHNVGIIHGNLRPSTVLVDEHFNPIIIGYGLQRTIDNNLRNAEDEAEISRYRMLAEIWQNPNAFSKESDVDSFAILLYHILGFKDDAFWKEDINSKVCNNKRPSLPLFPYWLRRVFRELIQNSWAPDRKERNPFSEIVNRLEENCILPGISKTEYQEYQATFNQNQSNS